MIHDPISILGGIFVVITGVWSLLSSHGKVDKTTFEALIKEIEKKDKMLEEQKKVDDRLQMQISEQTKRIYQLQKENDLEDAILENRNPKLEQALTALTAGMTRTLEILGDAEVTTKE